jgi:hypothetical protein
MAPLGRRSLASATGRRIGYPIPATRPLFPEADLRDPSPVSEVPDVANWDGNGALLATLIPRDGAAGGADRHTIRQQEVAIGRGSDNDVVIDDASVSEHHARLVLAGGVWSVTDLGSVNGTRVDGEPVLDTLPLATGSLLRIGQVGLAFSPHDRWEDSVPATSDVSDAISAPAAAGTSFDLGLPERRGFPVLLVVATLLTAVVVVAWLMSRGG